MSTAPGTMSRGPSPLPSRPASTKANLVTAKVFLRAGLATRNCCSPAYNPETHLRLRGSRARGQRRTSGGLMRRRRPVAVHVTEVYVAPPGLRCSRCLPIPRLTGVLKNLPPSEGECENLVRRIPHAVGKGARKGGSAGPLRA